MMPSADLRVFTGAQLDALIDMVLAEIHTAREHLSEREERLAQLQKERRRRMLRPPRVRSHDGNQATESR